MIGPERLSGADNSWRRLGSRDNLTTITGMMVFEDPMEYEDLKRQLERRVLRFERFRQAVGGRKRSIRRPYWETVENFDIDTHIHEINLAEPRDRNQLQRFVGTLISRPLDERRPLWEMFLIQEYEGGSAIVVRLNHSMADGFALMYVLFGLADDPDAIEFPIGGLSTPGLPEEEKQERESKNAVANGGSSSAIEAGGDEAESVHGDEDVTGNEADKSVGEATDNSDDDDGEDETDAGDGESDGGDGESDGGDGESDGGDGESDGGGLFGGLKLAGTAVKTGLGLLAMDDEPETSLHTDIGTKKMAGWTDELDIEPIKEIGEVHDATINTVMLGATAGVFRRTLKERGESVDDIQLRCTVPVNLKPMKYRDESLGNYFGLAFVPIPVGAEDLGERITIIRDNTSKQKLGIQAYIMYQVLNMGGFLPDSLFSLGTKLFRDNATGVVSNVPGPLNRIEIAGNEVEQIMFWNPQAMDQGLSVSIFTYNGGIRVGVSGDANLIRNPDKMTQAFEEEIAMLEEKYLD